MTLNEAGDKTYVKSATPDADGNRFEIALSGNLIDTLTDADFVFGQREAQEILYLPMLGQSNAHLLRMTEDDNQSGTSEMVRTWPVTPIMTCAASSPTPTVMASTLP